MRKKTLDIQVNSYHKKWSFFFFLVGGLFGETCWVKTVKMPREA